MIEKDGGVAWAAKFSGSDGGDHDAADDEEEIDADVAIAEEAEMVGGEVSFFDAVDVGKDDEEGGESSADLDADDLPGLRLRKLGHCALLWHYCINRWSRDLFRCGLRLILAVG
jgi:hypothetical protein